MNGYTTVQELINMLQKIEDKNKPVVVFGKFMETMNDIESIEEVDHFDLGEIVEILIA